MCVAAGVFDKALLGRDGTVEILGPDPLLFREAMGNHGSNIRMKEIKHAVVYAPDANAKLVDVVTQAVGLRAAKLMAQVAKPLQFDAAFIERLFRETIEPFQNGNEPDFW
jgi:hypothetical protein